jgi:uncharacterized protein
MSVRSSEARREQLLALLRASPEPITGSEFSLRLGVSRQAIVNDIAIMRAAGESILGGPRGYRIDVGPPGLKAVIRCSHAPDRGREEFEILLDRGIAVLDVGVEHSVFGEVRAPLLIETRADVDRASETIIKAGEMPLSAITRGIHSHTVRAPNRDALDAAIRELSERGILLDDQI